MEGVEKEQRLTVEATKVEIESIRQLLLKSCEVMLKNIATRISQEFIFQYETGIGRYYRILAGPGSAQTFRTNFMLRLAECFYNLRFLLGTAPAAFSVAEFVELERCYLTLKALGYPVQEIVDPLYHDLGHALALAKDNKQPPFAG